MMNRDRALETERPTRGDGGKLLVRALLLLLFAAVLALVVLLPFAPWTLRAEMVPYIVPWLLRPVTGFLPLTLVLWLLFIVPTLLRRAGGARRPVRKDEPARSARSRTGGAASDDDSRRDGGRLSVPSAPFRDLSIEDRWEMAEVLGIPWRDELIHDHQGWAIACLEAGQRRAAELRR